MHQETRATVHRTFSVGVLLLPSAPRELAQTGQAAEEAGFDIIALADSQSIARELWSSLAILGGGTTRVRLGPAVSNLVTRHPAVSVSGICTIDELTNGRAFLGLGTGDSAVYNLGSQAIPLAQLESGVRACRNLMAGETASWQGSQMHVQWASRRVPLFISAEGPRTLAKAGAICDGVIIGSGVDDTTLTKSLDLVRAGAAEADRSDDDIEKWALAKCALADSRTEAIDISKMALAASANHAFRYGVDDKNVPDEFVAAIREVQRHYSYPDHERTVGSANAVLTDRYGLTDWLAHRFGVIGDPDDCRTRLLDIARSGVDGVLLTAFTEDATAFVRRFGTDVLDPFRRELERL